MKFIPVSEPFLGKEEKRNVVDCLDSNWISSIGKYVSEFEEKFAAYCGVKYAVAVSNGTTALHLALASLGIGRGDEVVVPDLTFIATANAVTYTGAKPVFADSELQTWNITPDLSGLITKRTRAVIPVHLYGHPANLNPILSLAKKHSLCVVEDCAEAHGALYKGKKVGSFGICGVFSFYGNKIITSGEGGMVVTNNKKLCEKMRLLRDHAMSKKRRYFHPEIGFNYRLTNIQAAIGVGQLNRIGAILRNKIKIARLYSRLLRDIPGITLPPEEKWARNVYWMYSILVDGKMRNRLMRKLKESGIETRPFFIPMHKLTPYRQKGNFTVSEYLSASGINLPSSANLSGREIKYICSRIKDILQKG